MMLGSGSRFIVASVLFVWNETNQHYRKAMLARPEQPPKVD
jgi:hypothetical protein